jgi:hypothetical protein
MPHARLNLPTPEWPRVSHQITVLETQMLHERMTSLVPTELATKQCGNRDRLRTPLIPQNRSKNNARIGTEARQRLRCPDAAPFAQVPLVRILR